MKLAIVHYHLNPGGVTRVIENHLRALDAVLDPGDAWQVAVLQGGETSGWNESLADQLRAVRLTLRTVPGLGYDNRPPHPDRLADAIGKTLDELGFSPDACVLHVHNHALGKNRSLPGALETLARRGYPILAQLHDFAEDFRPANYRWIAPSPAAGSAECVYPQATHFHYAAINRRDVALLADAGVPPERLHLLPNPVFAPQVPADRAAARRRLARATGIASRTRLVLYPVRGIRRKNVGETLLHAALAPRGTVVAMTLPPLNPQELPRYLAWVELARQLDLPCRFDLAGKSRLALAENLVAADAVLTTSVAEGFGMVFLESWLLGRPLAGRDLPEITADFRDVAMAFPWLQPVLNVPLAWVGARRVARRLQAGYRRTCRAYGQLPIPDDGAFAARLENGLVDFADLDEALQAMVVQRVASRPAARGEVLACNPALADALTVTAQSAAETIAANADCVRKHFALEPSGRRLADLLKRVAGSPRGPITPLARPDALLSGFLLPSRFRPLRSHGKRERG